MGLRINTNIASLQGQRALSLTTERLEVTFRRLSTGLRIAVASDDAAGLALSERFRTQVRSTNQAVRNAGDGISVTQTAEGALNEVSANLLRMRELAIQAANGSVANTDRETLDQEFQALIAEIDRIARSATFNGVHLLDGTASTLTFQVGIGAAPGIDTISLTTPDTLASSLGLSTLDIGGGGNITLALTRLDGAIDTLSQIRGQFGAVQNRLQATITNLRTQAENLTASESRVRDADMALETAELTRNQILQQSAISVLTQANVHPQAVLQLLRT